MYPLTLPVMLFADVIIRVSVAEVSDNQVPESYIVLTGFFGFFKADNKYKSLCLKKKKISGVYRFPYLSQLYLYPLHIL